MQSLKHKLGTASRTFRRAGLAGVAKVVINDKVGEQWNRLKEWLYKDNWWVGKLIELKGNQISIDGCRFSVHSPAIPTALKSRFLFNKYEPDERQALNGFLDASLPVVELGGSVGVIACLSNKRLNDPGRHVVVEANPDLIPLLERNRDLNGCHFTVIQRALAYGGDRVNFYQSNDFLLSSVQLHAARSTTVPSVSLREIVEQFGFDRFTLICDIEGGEYDLVKFEADILRENVATFIVEVHGSVPGSQAATTLMKTLGELGFDTVFKRWETHVLQKRDGHQ